MLIIDFLKFDPLRATGMALYVNLGPKCQIVFPYSQTKWSRV